MNNNEKLLRKNIGKKIKLARSKSNYTQEKLAEKLSLSARYISQLERGIAFGSANTIVSLCKALNISTDFLFSDFIDSDSCEYMDLIDNKFLENYSQLNDYNKKIVNRLTNDLIKSILATKLTPIHAAKNENPLVIMETLDFSIAIKAASLTFLPCDNSSLKRVVIKMA